MSGERGAALILVLWVAVLLSVILSATVVGARLEARAARAERDHVLLEAATDAALHAAALAMSRRVGDADALKLEPFELNGVIVEVAISDEMRKLDINRASEEVMRSFFIASGLSLKRADRLSAVIADWRDADGLARPNGAEANDYSSAPGKAIGNRPFRSVSELSSALGVDVEKDRCLLAKVTIFGRDAPIAESSEVATSIDGGSSTAGRASSSRILGVAGASITAGELIVLQADARLRADPDTRKQTTRVYRLLQAPGLPFESVATVGRSDEGRIECE